jgi:hypothetical protein
LLFSFDLNDNGATLIVEYDSAPLLRLIKPGQAGITDVIGEITTRRDRSWRHPPIFVRKSNGVRAQKLLTSLLFTCTLVQGIDWGTEQVVLTYCLRRIITRFHKNLDALITFLPENIEQFEVESTTCLVFENIVKFNSTMASSSGIQTTQWARWSLNHKSGTVSG